MLTSGHIEISRRKSRSDHDADEQATEDHPNAVGRGRARRLLQLAAAALGLLGALLAVAVPLLPVIQDTTVITWPNGRHLAPVNAPLVTFQPQNLWATNIIAAALGIAFFLVVVVAEKLVVRRAPEHVA